MTAKKNKPQLFSQEYQKQWSETHKYKHIHTGEYCTFEAYVAEFIVLRRAEKLNLGKPAYKFWTKGDPNHWLWKKQLCAARTLKKRYSEEAVLAAIKSKEFDKLLVLGIQDGNRHKVNPAAEKIVAIYHKKLSETNSNQNIEVAIDNPPHEEVQIRTVQSYENKKFNINQLRNI